MLGKGLAALMVALVASGVYLGVSDSYVSDPNKEFIDRVDVYCGDQWGNWFHTTPKLMVVNTGETDPAGEAWTCSIYGLVIFYNGGGAGEYGDVVAEFEIWDARELADKQYVTWEFSRSGWSNYTISIDDVLVYYLPELVYNWEEPLTWDINATASYAEGVFP